jgi:hypothetical protein
MLRGVALLSLVYDVAVGLALLLAADRLAAAFGVPPASPAVFADTNGLFLVAVGLGYALPFRDPVTWRAYLWLMGPFLKGFGAAAFVRDVVVRGSPDTFLLFAVSDGTLAALTLLALWRERPPRPGAPGPAA